MGISYCSYQGNIPRKLVSGLVDEVFGYKKRTPKHTQIVEALMKGKSIGVPIEWAECIIDFKISSKVDLEMGYHESSEGVYRLEKIHPVIKAYLDKEGFEYELYCAGVLEYLENGK